MTDGKTCPECGLPYDICNSLAMYHEAIKYYKLGRTEQAGGFADSAKEFYDRYRAINHSRAIG